MPTTVTPRAAATYTAEALLTEHGHELVLTMYDEGLGSGYAADITRSPDVNATIHLSWTDGVANESTETFPDLSVALARLATLQRCSESGFHLGFAQVDAEAFAPVAAYFLDGATTT